MTVHDARVSLPDVLEPYVPEAAARGTPRTRSSTRLVATAFDALSDVELELELDELTQRSTELRVARLGLARPRRGDAAYAG